jgi:hypothetical protein
LNLLFSLRNSRWNHIASLDDVDVLKVIGVNVVALKELDKIQRFPHGQNSEVLVSSHRDFNAGDLRKVRVKNSENFP